jgi:hypothetical protein
MKLSRTKIIGKCRDPHSITLLDPDTEVSSTKLGVVGGGGKEDRRRIIQEGNFLLTDGFWICVFFSIFNSVLV